jgi:hypothetical protein
MNRKLSDAERVVWLVNQTKQNKPTAQTTHGHQAGRLNAGAVARVTGLVDEHKMRVALNWLQKRHPMLRTRMDVAGGRAPVAQQDEALPPIALRVEQRLSHDQWQAEAQHELSQPQPWMRGPMMSVVLVQSDEVSEIIVTLHHVMNDAASVLYLMRDLLGLLEQIIKGQRTPSLQVYSERRALDDWPLKKAQLMDSLLKTTAHKVTQVARAIQQRNQTPSAQDARVARALPKPSSPRHGDALHQTGCARMLHYVLSVDETARLLKQCQAENTTLHGALCAAMLKAAGEHICNGTPRQSAAVPVCCLSAPRIRRALPAHAGQEVGLLIPMVTAAHYIAHRARYWDVARHTETTLNDAIRNDDSLIALPLPHDMAARISEPQSGLILVTNVGRLGLPHPYGVVVPNETRADGKAVAMADCFGVVVNRLPNRVLLSFFYPDAALSEDRVGLLGAKVVKHLRAALAAE